MVRCLLQAIVVRVSIALLLIGFIGLTPQAAQAAVTQIEDASGQLLYRSHHRLRDDLGKAWQVVVFKQNSQDQQSSINLRLMGLPGTVEVVHPKALKIRTQEDQVFQADDILALLNASMNFPPHEVGRSPRQPFSLGRREPEIL
ncbi:MAG: DUF3122 domain-containing protein, partial [Phormidesmis sp. CAN_BIN36]|nr:DUF3122 domain-containing protein [Phormidesmis sp. CAN_BIN36]